ncbi:MAG TPA: VacJ family lipoprotein [Povalibacter sp.]|nr:VacJ family lipoprotein [Povalibacter sp.]
MSTTKGGALALARAIAIVTVLLVSAGCASTPGRTHTDDPLEGMNRGIYKFNDTLDRAALKPVAKGYRKITPRWVRGGIGNFFANLSYPTTIVNQFLQGKARLGLRDTGRFLVNSTIGVAGLLDVATPLGLTANDEDFGQTLAMWGVGSGPYLTLPFFGPSSLRDAPSKVFDYFLGPLVYIDIPWETEAGIRALNLVHDRSELLPLDATLQSAFDPYGFIREAWVQQREFAIYDGNPPPETLEDVLGEDEDEAPADGSGEANP